MAPSAFPKTLTLRDGSTVTLRPLRSVDRDALGDFFRRLSEEDRKFLKDDVTRPEVIDAWCREINPARVLPLIAEAEGKVVADATLHRRRAGWLRHVGEVRLVVDPEYRRKGLGSRLLEELTLLGQAEGLEKLVAEMTPEEPAARMAFERQGFRQVAVVPDLVRDQTGTTRDLLILVLDLGTALLPDWYY
ncbi:MAG TPA: GNAT family N-acetyltransferase [Candidatus Methylomirabilis sp.]|nr:GNAT family N-acetyltransferase [Candidatus Methylomirabilis sp.]